MNISVIIPSYNPTLHLEETIQSLVNQSKHIYQLVVVVDNEQQKQFADELYHRHKNDFRLLTVHVQANGGRAKARNKGVKMSEGDLLLFLDDDMIAERGFIEKHHDYHLANPESIVVGNGYRNPKDAKDDFDKYIISIEHIWKSNSEDLLKVSYRHFIFTACNLSMPRKVFDRLDGFDERLRDAEDFDLGARALQHAMNILYDKNLNAWHNDWPDIRRFINRHNQYVQANKELIQLHPDYAGAFPKLRPVKQNPLKKIILGIVGALFGWLTMGNSFLFKMLPLKLKFMLYRLAVASNSIHS